MIPWRGIRSALMKQGYGETGQENRLPAFRCLNAGCGQGQTVRLQSQRWTGHARSMQRPARASPIMLRANLLPGRRPLLTTVMDEYSRAMWGYSSSRAPAALNTELALRQRIWPREPNTIGMSSSTLTPGILGINE